ncbi:protein kinase domain-containing protein [Nonomuraea sp. bgisy101]|uniref:serine/threonine-protein kinase n=1 Tax=Nonomuraea sp. bgisy101 TaxID=3413784 RepID=UPI003D763B0A
MLPGEDAPGYRVLDTAGQGGFGVVYKAYQERLDRVVALKVLTVDRVDARTMRRFQRELQLTGRLTGHPNVVTVFDTGTTRSGKPYIAMEFFENGSLRDRVRAQGPLPVADVLRTGVKLAAALAAVHEAGVLHGDIKPQNILISRYGEPAIADFGVARVVDSSETSATAQAFTPLHAAPEVLSGQPHSASTDVYSLGSTLYHLLAGQPAFHSATDPSIAPLMFRVLSAEPPPINRADVPSAVAGAIVRAMAKAPSARYESAWAFARRLREVQQELGLPVTDLVAAEPAPGGEPTFPVRQAAPPAMSPSVHAPPATSPSVHAPPATSPSVHAPPAAPASGSPYAPAGSPPGPGSMAPTPVAPASAAPASVSPASVAPATVPPGVASSAVAAGPPHAPGAVHPGHPAPPGHRPDGGPRGHAEAPGYAEARHAFTAPARSGRSPLRGRLLIGGAVATVATAGALLVLLLPGRQPQDPGTQPKPPVAKEPQPAKDPQSAKPAEIGKAARDALAPRGLRMVADRGAVVTLRWTLPADARRYPLILQREPADGQQLASLQAGDTTARVVGLDPDTGYCFLVGAALEISQKSTVAWSKPYCIRGAVTR